MNNFFPKISSLPFHSLPLFQRCHGPNSCQFLAKPRRFIPMCRRLPPSSRRRRRRGLQPLETVSHTWDDDPRVKMIINVKDSKARVSDAIHTFLSSGEEAFRDLRNLISFDRDRGVLVLSYRRSSLEFLGLFLLCSLCLLAAIRVFVSVVFGLWFGRSRRESGDAVLVRRDRSLGGREVVVSRQNAEREMGKMDLEHQSPLPTVRMGRLTEMQKDKQMPKTRSLPEWWPNERTSQAKGVTDPEFQREANRIVRAITNNRLAGRDPTTDDILQLRRVCRASGARVSFDATNARDSFYRSSVNFVLNICCRSTWNDTNIQVDGEEAPRFLAGLAENIGLEDTRASNIVSAAVAAFTRSSFLQAWALEIQGKRAKALLELQKLCLVHRTFPPREHSPEMEMVARGLQKHLKLAHRQALFELCIGTQNCSTQNQRITLEALGLHRTRMGQPDRSIRVSMA